MAEFDESDLRPFTGLQRPITAKPEDDMQSDLPGPSRPMTSATRPMTSGRQGPPGSRPMTSMISRPSTGSVPEWMMDDDSQGPDRPKTGYRKPDGSVEVICLNLYFKKLFLMLFIKNIFCIFVVIAFTRKNYHFNFKKTAELSLQTWTFYLYSTKTKYFF